MRTLALMLAASLAACSRAGGGAADRRHKSADMPSRELARDESPATEPRVPRHVSALPSGFGGEMTAGAEPSSEHLAGTIYLMGIPPGSRGVTIAEWDLASGKALRRAVLPLDRVDLDPVVTNAGGTLHLVHRGLDESTYYLRLSPELKVLSRTPVDDLRGGDANAVASDGKVTVIVGPYPSLDGTAGPCFAATYDDRGKLIAHRALREDAADDRSAQMFDDAAVINGKVYILLPRGDSTDWHAGLRVVEYTSDLTPIASSVVPLPPENQVERWRTVHARGDRLLVDLPPARYEFSSDLAEMKESTLEMPPAAQRVEGRWCVERLRVGPVHATLCYWPRDRPEDPVPGPNLIAWDRYDGEP